MPIVLKYMGFVQDNAESAVLKMLEKMDLPVYAEDHMDDGT